MVTYDGAGASHDLIACLDKLARRTGHQLVYSVGWEVNHVWDRSQVIGGTTSLGQFEISLKNIGTGIATAANKPRLRVADQPLGEPVRFTQAVRDMVAQF